MIKLETLKAMDMVLVLYEIKTQNYIYATTYIYGNDRTDAEVVTFMEQLTAPLFPEATITIINIAR